MRAGALIDPAPTVQAAVAAATGGVRAAGVEPARVEAEWLLAGILGVPRGALGVDARRLLASGDAERYAAALRRRLAREPLQHILGSQAFRHVTVEVSRAAMVPRPETEMLAEWALQMLADVAAPLVIDLGTGSGCLACAMASERTDARVIALDVSPAAVTLARRNVAALGLAERVTVERSDLFAALDATVRADLIVSNPPYLPTGLIAALPPEVSRHDPRLALDGGADGLDVIRRLAGEAPRWLGPGGRLALETAGGDQAAEVVALLEAGGFVAVETRADLAGVVRFVAGRRS